MGILNCILRLVAPACAAIATVSVAAADPIPSITEDGFIAITDPDAVIGESMPPKPAYRGRITSQPFGTRIRRIAGDPGTPIVTPTGAVIGLWTALSRHHYVTTQAWNTSGSMMHIYLGRDDVSPNNLILSGSSYKPLYAYYETRRDSRWHPVHPSIRIVITGSMLSWYNVKTATHVRTWSLPYRENIAGGKWNVSEDGRYIGIVGENRYLYVFDTSTRKGRAGPSFDLRTACGLPACEPPSVWFDVRTAPDGLRFLVHYGPDSDWRLLEADAATLEISPHAFPAAIRPAECASALICSNGSVTDGFLPMQLGHPDFTTNTDETTWIVGQSKYWSNKAVSSVDTVAGKVGRILGIRIDSGDIKSLTDPVNEAWATHVSVRSTLRPGWVYASYNRSPPGKYMGEILAVNLNDRRIERYAHHYSTTQGCYDCETHPSPSPDGSKIAFASTWGDDQSVVQGYVLELLPDPP